MQMDKFLAKKSAIYNKVLYQNQFNDPQKIDTTTEF